MRNAQAANPADARDLLIALNASSALPRGAACRLAARFASWFALPRAALDPRELGVPAAALTAACGLRERAGEIAAAEIARAQEHGAAIVTLADAAAPDLIRMLDLPPPAIYVQGGIPDAPAVAVVGARRATRYGLDVAERFGHDLAAAGLTVVSGFAVGVDAAAHRGALAAPGGRTVAILGCGLDIDYPRGQRALARRIVAAGARLTEFPPGRPPLAHQFPVRNRLIAALARACVVIEAAPRSGSLVTARLALDAGREVLAVPGRIDDETALGTNQLIADGARPALDAADVLEAIGLATTRPTARRSPADVEPSGLDEVERAIWRAARETPATSEELAARCALPVDRALVALLSLELAGQLRRGADGVYSASS